MSDRSRQRRWGLAGAGTLLFALASLGATAAEDRFIEIGQTLGAPADWVSVDENRMAFGSGHEVHLARAVPTVFVERRTELTRPVVDGVLLADRIYTTDGTSLFVVELDAASPTARRHTLDPAPAGPLGLARMDDYLVVSEGGVGIRILAMLPPPEHRTLHRHHLRDELEQVGDLALDLSVTAMATSRRKLYLATQRRGIVVVDIRDLAAPVVETSVAMERPVQALAANGRFLYILDGDGMNILELDADGGVRSSERHTGSAGTRMFLSGRTLHLAGGDTGITTLVDQSPLAKTHFVEASGFSFTPADVTVAPGDTVQWNNVSGFHNVEACDGASGAGGNDPDPPGCGGQIAVEGFFTSGNPGFGWQYSKSFTLEGTNRYFCEVHAGVGMFGNVQVVGVAPPPGVPDGTDGTPVEVDRLATDGSQLRLTFDTTTCTGNLDHQIVYGFGSQLPASPGGTYAPAGAECAVPGSPYTWLGTPDPAADPTGLLWFLVLADDGATTEGSWGGDSAGTERQGPGGDGSSDQCGITAKDLTNVCGQ